MNWHVLALFGMFWHGLACFGMVWHVLAWLILVWHIRYEYMYAISSLNIPKSKPNHTKPNQISWYGMVWTKKEILSLLYPLRIFEISAFLSHFLEKKQKKLDLTHF